MGDDLVLTLRNEAVEFITPVSAAVAMEKAADEIERLRKENETLRTMARELAEEIISLGGKNARKT